MRTSEMYAEINEARTTLHNADRVSESLLPLLVGRLRKTGTEWNTTEALRALKRELRDFNMTTGTWNEK